MFDYLFYVVGGSFLFIVWLFEMFDSLLCYCLIVFKEWIQGLCWCKFWEIVYKFYCLVIGVCFGVYELCSLMVKIIYLFYDVSDFLLYILVVGVCEECSLFVELL